MRVSSRAAALTAFRGPSLGIIRRLPATNAGTGNGPEKRNFFSGLAAVAGEQACDEALQFRQLWAISPARSDWMSLGPRARNFALRQDFRPDFRTPFDRQPWPRGVSASSATAEVLTHHWQRRLRKT
jgi:hypothetical protein